MAQRTPQVALSTRGLTKDFRGFRAVNSIDLDVLEGGVHALVGPNYDEVRADERVVIAYLGESHDA